MYMCNYLLDSANKQVHVINQVGWNLQIVGG